MKPVEQVLMSRAYRGFLKYALLLIAVAFISLPAFAATLTVTNLNDSGAGSLRGQIAAANPGDTIAFQPGLTGTITLTSAGLAIIKSLTISGPGATILAVSGNNLFQVFGVTAGTVFISGLTIENGNGGGIFRDAAPLTVTDCIISGNTGGGIYTEGGAGNSLTVIGSTISGNKAGAGGGIFVSNGGLTVINSTISGNTGGGIVNSLGIVSVTNSTISGNTGAGIDGGVGASLKSAIVANTIGGVNCLNAVTSLGYNLSDDGTCGFGATGDLNNTPAGLDPNGLQNNGGPTPTIALLLSSPAVNAIPISACTDQSVPTPLPVTTDQRGVLRPQGPGCDVGAFELVPPAFAIRYASNLNMADSVVNITNTGASATAVLANQNPAQNNINGSICINIYTFAADEQEVACCSCLVTPNALWSASVKTALLNSTLTPSFPNEVVIKLLSTIPLTGAGGTQTCNPAAPTNASLTSGLLAWGTSVHGVPTATGPTFSVAETPFSPATVTAAELARDVQECQFIQILGSGQFGICKGCSNVGLGAAAQ